MEHGKFKTNDRVLVNLCGSDLPGTIGYVPGGGYYSVQLIDGTKIGNITHLKITHDPAYRSWKVGNIIYSAEEAETLTVGTVFVDSDSIGTDSDTIGIRSSNEDGFIFANGESFPAEGLAYPIVIQWIPAS